MAIRQLSLTDFRNLKSTTLDFHPRLNLIHGLNGSGKTSLLEAVHVLSCAASFRSAHLKSCITHGRPNFLLFGRFEGFSAGLSRSQESLDIKVDGTVVQRRSDLASRAPVNIVDHDSFSLLDGSPQNRRQFMDWGLFHVEPEYRDNWFACRHALKQRNKLLKSRSGVAETLPYWDQHLSEPSEVISTLRKRWCQRIAAYLSEAMDQLAPGIDILLSYQRGWSEEKSLSAVLQSVRERDVRLGHSSVGIHRDDILLESGSLVAHEVLSRGQQKRVCLALLVASLRLVQEETGKSIILLVDDMNAEMDDEARVLVMELLQGLDMQLFITNVSPQWSVSDYKDCKMFHVEHGTIKPQKTS